MPTDPCQTLVETVLKNRLLEPLPQDEFTRLAPKFRDPRALAKELLQRGWLTAYQVNQLLQGRGAELVLGSYIILERLSEGPVGELFKARHQHMRREAAVQVVRAELLRQPEAVERFYQEVQRASQLVHANLVAAYDAGPVGATHFLAMEYVDGIDLERLVQQNGPLPVATACDYLLQTARGLQHAAERGLLHHYLKPANILVSRPDGPLTPIPRPSGERGCGQVKIRNLGLTLIRLQSRHSQAGSTTPAEPAGLYAAPEQAQPGDVKDVRSLFYSLGCTGYFLLSGTPPISGSGRGEVMPLEQRRGDLPVDVVSLIDRLMAPDPADRPQSFAELLQDLTALPALGGPGGTASARWQARRRQSQGVWPVTVAAGGIALLIGIGFIIFLLSRGTSATPTGPERFDSLATKLVKNQVPALVIQCGKGAGKQQDQVVTPGFGYQLVQGELFDGWDPSSHKTHCWYHPELLRFNVTVPPREGGTLRLRFLDADKGNRQQKLTVQGKEIGTYAEFWGVGKSVDVPILPSAVPTGVIEVALQKLGPVNAVVSTVEYIPDVAPKRR